MNDSDDGLNRSFYEDVAEQLYNLDRKELRRLAYEALLISDGPDHITGSVDDAAIHAADVRLHPRVAPVFVVRPKAGQR